MLVLDKGFSSGLSLAVVDAQSDLVGHELVACFRLLLLSRCFVAHLTRANGAVVARVA
jgi:hypothetical protein